MNLPGLRIRRATTDDLPGLKPLWRSMLLPADELEKRLTEFQVAETADGKLIGAIGVQIAGRHARLHSESYVDFAHADAARQLFWERLQTLASNHGVFRLWTQESSPVWSGYGFRSATAAKLANLPTAWQPARGEWFTLQLKDEETIAQALDEDLAAFMSLERQNTERAFQQARTLKTVITVIGFTIGIVCFVIAAYLVFHRGGFLPSY
jgi:N-acetylglutamate synthase-like GNAT family acetyltransferase